jgi:hypothetical protein
MPHERWLVRSLRESTNALYGRLTPIWLYGACGYP